MNVGKELRKLRIKKGYTMKYLASNAGISQALISQIERNVVDPSLKTLRSLLRVLDTDISTFFLYDTTTTQVVFRNDERTKLNLKNEKIVAENLTDITTNKEMQPLKITIPRDEEFTSDEYKHRGEEFGYVLKGEGILKLKNKIKDHVLKPGDSFYLHSHLFDRIINSGKEDLEIIWVSTPPTI